MDEQAMEMIIMQLIVDGGNARSLCIEALRKARDEAYAEADKLLDEANEVLAQTHETQAELLKKDMSGEHIPIHLIMVHAQDHLMNAMTVRDLVVEMVDILKSKGGKL